MGISAETHDFKRVAIVCRMKHQKPHHKIAYECFHYWRNIGNSSLSAKKHFINSYDYSNSEKSANVNEYE